MRTTKYTLAALAFCLLSPLALHAGSPVIITEFMASNARTLADENGDYPDWIEIQNVSTNTVNLGGWFLTDSSKNLNKWSFPATNLAASQFMVVFASAKDRRVPGAPLHTNFKLSSSGGFLALVQPNGTTIATEFASYPVQVSDVSYGFPIGQSDFTLLPTNAYVRALVPTNGNTGSAWLSPTYNDSAWLSGTNGVGFDTGALNPGEDAVTLVSFDASWKYLIRTNDIGSTDWRGANFDDSAWVSGNGVFAYPIGEPLPGGVTANATLPLTGQCLTNGVYVQTVYFRTSFNYTGPTNNLVLTFSNVVDDGLVFYLNGQEIGQRINMPAGTVAWTTAASSAVEALTSGVIVFQVQPTNVIQGSNVIAVELHNAATSSSDLVFGMSLTAWQTSGPSIPTNPPSATNVSFTNQIGTDLSAMMFGANSSAYIRYLFNVDNPQVVDRLTLRLKYDDGFAAYLNGVLVATRNASSDVYSGPLPWNAAATTFNPDASAVAGEDFNITSSVGALMVGTNVLAIQGLNTSATNADFLISASLLGSSGSQYSPTPYYFMVPTPGALNAAGTTNLGPVISSVGRIPAVPQILTTNNTITVTARVSPALGPVTSVTLYWRVMWGTTNQLTMFDDGLHGDGAAGDGIFGATIPAPAAGAGQMVRWFIQAGDNAGRVSRWPLFADPSADSQYEGTMIDDPAAVSQLQIWHFFLDPSSTNYTGIDTESGGRASMYFGGVYYDNIYMELRGNTTAGYPKKSHRVEFNSDHPLTNALPGVEIRKTSLLSEQADPAYLRTYLSFWLLQQMGVPSPFDYPVHCRLNGAFWGVWFHNDVIGAEQVSRLGYDPLGALYKAVGTATPNYFSTGGFQKKTRLWEDRSDYDTLARNINETNSLANRRTYIFDNLNLPEIVNYMATARWNQEGDDVWANMSLYRDTLGTKEWFVIPFDLNVSWGQLYCGDASGTYNQVVATNDMTKSHPLYGGSQVQVNGSANWNRLYDVIIAVPETRQMLLRRERTMLEKFIQPPGTTPALGLIERQITYLTNMMWTDIWADRTRNGWPCGVGSVCGMYCWGQAWPDDANFGVPGIVNKFVTPRRTHFWATHCITNSAYGVGLGNTYNAGIPFTQPTNGVITLVDIDFNPTSGNQAEEYLCLTNPVSTALDISGWQVDGAVKFTFKPGTIIPSNSVLYVASDLNAFRARATGPRGGQGLFVVGPYTGQLSARGETILVLNDTGSLVASNTYAGNPSLAQQFLRITEIMYNPAPLAGNTNDAQEFEFIEFKNISSSVSLDLRGIHFTNGVEFSFSGSAVTNLGPGQRVLIVKNLATFTARYGSLTNIAGAYTGYLNNGGERVTLLDSMNEEILDFSYDNKWYPFTDGQGFSLVIVDETAQPDAWGQSTQWRPSAYENGSPGAAEPNPPSIEPVFVNELLSHPDVSLGQTEAVELFNPNTNVVDLSGWYLTDNANVPKKYRVPNGTVLPAGAYLVLNETEFNPSGLGFSFSAAGEEVWLFSGDTNGVLTGSSFGFSFGAAEAGVSFGRYVNSQGSADFVAQSAQTFGTNNALPLVGPVVINEIMYHPASLTTNDPPASFIELLNITATNVPLFHAAQPTNTWHLRKAADFDFPTNVTLPPGGTVLVVGFDPATNATALAAFRSRYGVATNAPIYGPWQGSLPNNDAAVELNKPDPSVSSNPPYVTVDKVHYYDTAPWPCGTDGTGASLQRQRPGDYGNDPINWAGAVPTPGSANTIVPPGAPVITTAPVAQATTYGAGASFSVVACGLPQYFQWIFNGTNLPLATNATLVLTNVQAEGTGPYAVVVWNLSGSVTSAPVALTVQAPPPPGITGQPLSRIIAVSNAVSFSVVVTGAPPLSFQWRLAGTNLPAATSNPFSLASAQFADAGTYTIVVSNPGGSVTSAPALLTVLQPPAVTLQPQSQTVYTGSNATFAVTVSGSAPFALQWLYNGTNLPNATNATLTLTNVQPTQSGSYQVRATNLVGVAFSDLVTLIVPVAITITAPPQSQSVWPYSNTTFSVSANGSQPIGYQWRWNGTNILNATNTSLAKTSVLPADAGSYSVLITNTISAVTSAPAVLTVFTNPIITTQPLGRSAPVSSNAIFMVVAFSSSPLRYQWFFNTNTTISGATNDTLTFTNVQTSNYGFYNVRVFDTFGSTWSDPAQMADKLKPTISQQLAPTNTVILLGTPITFSIGAVGPTPLSFRWRRGGNTLTNFIQNDSLSTYSIPAGILPNLSAPFTNLSASFTNAGGYDVVVTNSAGNAPSSTKAYLSIMAPLTNQTARLGSNVTFSFVACSAWPNAANTTYNLRYSWWFNDTNLLLSVTNLTSSLTNITLNLTNVQYAQEGTYKVLLTTSNNTAGSQSATLTILRPPAITDQPTNQSVSSGDSAVFTVGATGVPAPGYQWRFNQTNLLAGATSPTLTLTNVQPLQAGGYSVVVSNSVGAVTSLVAQLTVTVSTPPHLDGVLGPPAPGGPMQFSFDGVAGQSYSVLWREFLDKNDWQPLTNISLLSSNQPVLIQDNTTGLTQRFYRVVMPMRQP